LHDFLQFPIAGERKAQLRIKIKRPVSLVFRPDSAKSRPTKSYPARPNTGPDAFKSALYLISSGLQGVDARIGNTLHNELVVEARDGIEDQVEAIVKYSLLL
jgi:hypothetical protein